ncbi:hypothetical protein B1C78_02510 [Thioalkalivibrio denitrificans]|uniref:HNH nuclease domain-containing protein n=1 Tax=Thioalkalivibrio denitrificans TaxID=108003 RepID=A0A1V3NSC5_9GAMM|nr:HNH endonuclease [Thioalkalivibrio denitrificans]OOG27863.1 hypothetical protein B1C78_02510 [Thioalkalivibrio denitrificans]
MARPTEREQIGFLRNLQRLLAEGNFVATYKYALLLALADIAVEHGADSDDELRVPLEVIAEKFIQYYWPQSRPFPRTSPAQVLQQNTGQQAAIINAIVKVQNANSGSLARIRSQPNVWARLVRKVAAVIKEMPLWRLQLIGDKPSIFLYPHSLEDNAIRLLPGVAYNFRAFHPLITNMIQGAWIAAVRRLDRNQPILGQRVDLVEFMFGSERQNLAAYRQLLLEIDGPRCFYCERQLRAAPDVDHFIPRARYPVDLGHNFVLAHPSCNRAKSDHLAALDHLQRWRYRNEHQDGELAEAFDRRGLLHDRDASYQIARWAYAQADLQNGLLWKQGSELTSLSPAWRAILSA